MHMRGTDLLRWPRVGVLSVCVCACTLVSFFFVLLSSVQPVCLHLLYRERAFRTADVSTSECVGMQMSVYGSRFRRT